MVATYEDALALTPTGATTATFQVTPDWAQGRAAFGGLVAGVAVRAAGALLPADRAIRSVMVDFVSPVGPGEAAVTVRVLREGRYLSHVEARVTQGGADAAIVVLAAGSRRASAIRWASPPAPEAAPPDASVALPFLPGVTPTFTQHFEYRWTSPRFPFSGADRANLGGWVRRRDHGPVDVAGVLALIDAWPAPILPLLTKPAAASSVTWMVDLVTEPPAGGWPGDAFFRFECDAIAAWDGYADIRGHLWAPDGRLVATSTQLVAEFSA